MKTVSTADAPQAVGPYSQAVISGPTIFCSGQIPIDPATGQLVEEDIAAQTRQVFRNLAAVLEAAGASLQRIAKTTVFLQDMSDFPAMNAAYEECLAGHKPARATVEVAALPLGARVEIEAIAYREENHE